MADPVPVFADSQTYRRGAVAAAVGLVVQLALSIFVSVLAIWGQSLAFSAAAWHMVGGLFIWAVLWIVYQQHKLERIESLEAEQLAATDQEAARLFDEAGQQLAMARNRLKRLYKYGLNIVTVFVAMWLWIAGAMLGNAAKSAAIVNADGSRDWSPLYELAMKPNVSPGLILAATVFYGLVAFLTARSIAGMTKEPAWQLLRGGAAYLMGCLAIAIGLAISAALELAGIEGGFALMAILTPLIMILLGIEMLLSFVFGLYRPRRAGEAPRAAFDSRLLGFLTRPESLGRIVTETLRYQFGIDFSGSWVYQLLGKALLPLAAFAIALLLGLSTLVFVGPSEQAVITTWGGNPRYVTPGLHFKLPWPAGRVESYEVDQVHQTIVGAGEEGVVLTDPVLWSSEIAAETQEFFITAASRATSQFREQREEAAATQPGESAATAPDAVAPDDRVALGELAVAVAAVRWKIDTSNGSTGLENYLTSARRPDNLIQAVAMQEVTRFAGSNDIDRLLSLDRLAAGRMLANRMNERLGPNGFDIGVKILDVGLVTVQPPAAEEVASSFQQQASALQERNIEIENSRGEEARILAEVAGSRRQAMAIEAAISELNTLRNRNASLEEIDAQRGKVEALIAGAGGEASRLIAEARSDRTRMILEAESRAREFPTQLAAYNAAPRYYVHRVYFKALAEGLQNGRKFILTADTETAEPTIRLELQDRSSGLDLSGGN